MVREASITATGGAWVDPTPHAFDHVRNLCQRCRAEQKVGSAHRPAPRDRRGIDPMRKVVADGMHLRGVRSASSRLVLGPQCLDACSLGVLPIDEMVASMHTFVGRRIDDSASPKSALRSMAESWTAQQGR